MRGLSTLVAAAIAIGIAGSASEAIEVSTGSVCTPRLSSNARWPVGRVPAAPQLPSRGRAEYTSSTRSPGS